MGASAENTKRGRSGVNEKENETLEVNLSPFSAHISDVEGKQSYINI